LDDFQYDYDRVKENATWKKSQILSKQKHRKLWHSPTAAANSWSAANVDKMTAATAGKPLGMVAGKLIGGGGEKQNAAACAYDEAARRLEGPVRTRVRRRTTVNDVRASRPICSRRFDVCARHLDDPNATPPLRRPHRRPPPPRQTAVWNDRVHSDSINHNYYHYCLMSYNMFSFWFSFPKPVTQ